MNGPESNNISRRTLLSGGAAAGIVALTGLPDDALAGFESMPTHEVIALLRQELGQKGAIRRWIDQNKMKENDLKQLFTMLAGVSNGLQKAHNGARSLQPELEKYLVRDRGQVPGLAKAHAKNVQGRWSVGNALFLEYGGSKDPWLAGKPVEPLYFLRVPLHLVAHMAPDTQSDEPAQVFFSLDLPFNPLGLQPGERSDNPEDYAFFPLDRADVEEAYSVWATSGSKAIEGDVNVMIGEKNASLEAYYGIPLHLSESQLKMLDLDIDLKNPKHRSIWEMALAGRVMLVPRKLAMLNEAGRIAGAGRSGSEVFRFDEETGTREAEGGFAAITTPRVKWFPADKSLGIFPAADRCRVGLDAAAALCRDIKPRRLSDLQDTLQVELIDPQLTIRAF